MHHTDVPGHIISDEGDFPLNTRSIFQEQDTQDFWATATKEPSDILAKNWRNYDYVIIRFRVDPIT